MLWLKLAFKEIRNQKKFALFFCLNLSLGLCGFIVLDAFKNTLEVELNQGSKNILSADLSIRVRSKRFGISQRELITKTAPIRSEIAETVSLYTMASTQGRARLVQLVAISENHPLAGTIQIEGMPERATGQALRGTNDAWLYPELAVQLDLEIGQLFKMGNQSFKVSGFIAEDSTDTASAFNFAPRVYVSNEHIESLGLLAPGSRFSESLFVLLPKAVDLAQVQADLNEALSEFPDYKVKSHLEASENLARALTYLTDYLGLIALVALFLSSLGSAYLFRSFLLNKRHEIATLMSLGTTPKEARRIFLLQLFVMGTLAAALSITLSYFLFPFVPMISEDLLPFTLYPQLSIRVVVIGMIMGTLGSVLICLPLLASISSMNAASLFQESPQSVNPKPSNLLLLAPVLVLYYLLSVWEANSFPVGSIFIGTFVGASCLLGAISWVLFSSIEKIRTTLPLNLRLALRNLNRNKLSTGSCFLTISLGAMLISLVPQIHDIVLEEVSNPPGFELPSLFLVDIQPDQLPELRTLLKENSTDLQYESPLVRARLLKINQEEVHVDEEYSGPSTREQQGRRWVRQRGQNLTYRQEVFASEKIIEGRPFSGTYSWDKATTNPEVSLEMRFAKRLGVTIGDQLQFNIQGVEVTATIVSIRRIKWTSFQPNFFITLQPGVLDDAPKVYIAAVPSLEKTKKLDLQNQIVEAFPNISIIDVESTVRRILNILEKMGWIIRAMAYFTLIAGFVVLFSIANHQAILRKWDINLLKILGAKFSDIRASILWEFSLLGLSSATFGALAGMGVSYAFASYVFESPWQPAWTTVVGPIAGIFVITIVTAYLATAKVLQEKPLALLNEG